jgi:predicted transcriptional regulator/DNA-binding XRE family transcriptional regulator
MAKQPYLGSKIRRLRMEAGYTQVRLAQKLEISPSYLNLIEKNQRALTVPLLLKLAEVFTLDLKAFAEDDEGQLVAALKEIFGDPVFADRAVGDREIRELLAASPRVARAVQDLYRAYRTAHEDAQTLAARMTDGDGLFGLETSRAPSEDVSAFIQSKMNHFPQLEDAAEQLWRDAPLARRELVPQLIRYLKETLGIRVDVVRSDDLGGAVRRYSVAERRLLLSEALPRWSLMFQIAHQVGLLAADETITDIVDQAFFTGEEQKRLARVTLANYFAGALLMPYGPFLEVARSVKYDVEVLEHRFHTSFEQVCHRLTSLHRPGAAGIPFHMVRIDIAGNLSKRFSGSGIPFARYSGACPRWNVHAAFLSPGFIRTQLSEMPDGRRYFSIARTVRKAGGGHHVAQNRLAIELGCEAQYARQLVYADGVDLDNRATAVPVGVSCRLCERMDCRQRAFPPMHHRLDVDENVRGLSFYYSTTRKRG